MEHSYNILEQIQKISSQDRAAQLDGLVAIRKLLSIEQNPPIDEIIASGVVPKLFEFMKPDNEEKFQLESCWAVTNICSGTSQHTQYVISLGGLDSIISVLNSDSAEVAEQAIWALGNIIGDSQGYSDLCLKKGAIDQIVSIFNKFPNKDSLRTNGIWAMTNCLRNSSTYSWDQISNAVAILKNVLAEKKNKEIIVDALWGIFYCTKVYAQEIIDFGFVTDLVHHLQDEEPQVIIPTLSALSNIISGSVCQAETVLKFKEFLPGVVQKLSNLKRAIRKIACKIISDVITRSQQGLLFILKDSDCINTLINIAKSEGGDVREEAICALTNIALTASKEQVTQLQDQFNYLQCLLNLLDEVDAKVLERALEAISYLWNPENDKYFKSLVEAGDDIVHRLETLSIHQNEHISKLAKDISKHINQQEEEQI